MYQLVKTKKQQRNFEWTWEYFCNKYLWYNDPYSKNGARYNLMNEKDTIGTIEFIPYIPNRPTSTVEGKSCDFSQFHAIAQQKGKVWEVDKLCINEEYQRQGHFNQFIEVFYDHMSKYKPIYYLAFIEERFYRMLKINFRLQIDVLGEPLIEHNTKLLPVSIKVDDLINRHYEVFEEIIIELQRNGEFLQACRSKSFWKSCLKKYVIQYL